MSQPIDLTALVPRLRALQGNSVFAYEGGRVVRRSFEDVYADVQAARAALTSWGVEPGMRVGIRSPNCYQWIVYDLALIDMRAVSVAFTEDFASAGAEELRERYGLSLLLAGPRGAKMRTREATFVAHLDGDNEGVRVAEGGRREPDEHFDRPWLIFSSGSSGGVKGLVLNRKGVEAWVDAFTRAVGSRPEDRLLLFLPFSNFQQRPMYYAALWYGFDFIITEPARLFIALKELQPTILVAPPALYEAFEARFHNLPRWKRVAAQAAGGFARALPAGAGERLARLVFKQAHEALGGRMRFMVTGMAPIKGSTLSLFERMRLPLFETYGLIECGSVTINLPSAKRVGSVGRPLSGVEVELAADGEIIVRREHMTALGYFESAPGESEMTFIGGNRVATGDVGRLDEDGYLYLVGRKKEVIITAGGEKVHPEAVEAEINACADVEKSVVFGGPSAPSLCAVVLPKEPHDAGARGRIEHFVENLKDRRAANTVGRVVFTDLAFTRENGFLRPNLKLDRRRIAEHFRAEIGDIGS